MKKINQTISNIKKIQNVKINTFMNKMKKTMKKECPYAMNLLKLGSKSKNDAGLRVSELGKQIKADFGQMFFYDLVDNAMRVPHWHSDGDEIGMVLKGEIRITIWNGKDGEKHEFTAAKNGTWFIPRGTLHCLENVSNSMSEFLVCYNNPDTADRDFLDAWHSLPTEIICSSTMISKKDAEKIRSQQIHNRLSKFEPNIQKKSTIHYSPYSNNFNNTEPIFNNKNLGEIRKIGPNNTVEMKMAWQKTILKPGALRIPHWYTNSNVLLYVHKGSAFVTILDSIGDGIQEKCYTFVINKGYVLSLPTGFFHSILNIGDDNLIFYEAFMSGETNEISLLKGVKELGNSISAGALGLSTKQTSLMLNNKAPEFIVKF